MNVLIIGLGGIGQRYLRLLKSNYRNVNVYAIRKKKRAYEIDDTLSLNKKTDIIKKYDITVLKDIKLLKDIEINWCIICSPTSRHLLHLKKLIDKNIPVLIEKPLSDNLSKSIRLIDYAQKKNCTILTAHMQRFNPCVVKLKKLIDNNFLGNLYSVQINVKSLMPSWHKYENYKRLYAARKDMGGGVILTESHEIDLINWIFGNPTQIQVKSINEKISKYIMNVEDTSISIMKFIFKNRKLIVSLNQSFVSLTPARSIKIEGEKGLLTLDLNENVLTLQNAKKKRELFNCRDLSRNDLFLKQIKYFYSITKLKHIKNKILDNGLNTLRLLIKLKRVS